jgi:hypothetical protein
VTRLKQRGAAAFASVATAMVVILLVTVSEYLF